MKTKIITQLSFVSLLLVIVFGCAPVDNQPQSAQPQSLAAPDEIGTENIRALAEEQPAPATNALDEASQLPVRYQKSSYILGKDESEATGESRNESGVFSMPVGADIRSTTGPITLKDILKRLAALKNMNVSWASDVDQYALVDVDIRSGDDFFQAVDNILRQLDYFHEVKGNTIVVRFKETRKFHVALPFTSYKYSNSIGGDVLGTNNGNNALTGNVRLASDENHFDIWSNIKTNLDQILDIWAESPTVESRPVAATSTTTADQSTTTPTAAPASRPNRSSSGKGYYSIDRPVGLITVTAPRPLVEKIAAYLKNLKTELYRQISIEAKIIEVTLDNQTKTGIDWSGLLDQYSLTYNPSFGDVTSRNPLGNNRSLFLSGSSFNLIVSALESQGKTTVLANPKLSVLNGQPAMINIGRSSTYIDSVTSTVSDNVVTTTVTTGKVMAGLGMGVIATIMDNDEIVLSLIPVTSDLKDDTIEYISFGNSTVGIPVVDIKELSTVVRVKDGGVLVVGGLIDKINSNDSNNVPFLGKIPLIGKLFSSENKRKARSELIIVLRPKIIS